LKFFLVESKVIYKYYSRKRKFRGKARQCNISAHLVRCYIKNRRTPEVSLHSCLFRHWTVYPSQATRWKCQADALSANKRHRPQQSDPDLNPTQPDPAWLLVRGDGLQHRRGFVPPPPTDLRPGSGDCDGSSRGPCRPSGPHYPDPRGHFVISRNPRGGERPVGTSISPMPGGQYG
jgi:hypothetical protein